MTGLRLSLVEQPGFALDLSTILPEHLARKSIDMIRRIRLAQGRRRVALGDLFEIGETNDDTLEIHGATDRLRRIGFGMNRGVLHVVGNAGDELGACMTGGEIRVSGNAGDYLGSGMRGGAIKVTGNTGDFTAGALPHAALGMRDGVICVGKTVGIRAGDRMRRGLLVVNGDAGRYCGSNLIAGTIVIIGQTAPGIGTGMRRGTILLLNEPSEIPPTFNDCGTFSLPILALLLRHISAVNRKAYNRLRSIREVRRLAGDIGCNGQGELLVAAQSDRS